MFRQRSSHMVPTRSSHTMQHPNTMPAPPARTLRLESPMTRSTANLQELAQFDFGLKNTQPTPEPLFQDTFYLSSEDEPSPITPQTALSAMWAIERLASPELQPSRRSSEDQDSINSDYDVVTVETFTATKVTYYKHGKPRKVETSIQRPESMSRNSSISTRETIFSGPSDGQSRRSTPASSISEYQNISPSIPSRYSQIPYAEPKVFAMPHKQNATISLGMIEERPGSSIDEQPPMSPFAKRRAPRAKKEPLHLPAQITGPISPVAMSPATPDLRRRRSMWHRK